MSATDPEDRFDEIIQRALSEIAAVNCTRPEYQDGLRFMIEETQTALQASLEDDRRDAARG